MDKGKEKIRAGPESPARHTSPTGRTRLGSMALSVPASHCGHAEPAANNSGWGEPSRYGALIGQPGPATASHGQPRPATASHGQPRPATSRPASPRACQAKPRPGRHRDRAESLFVVDARSAAGRLGDKREFGRIQPGQRSSGSGTATLAKGLPAATATLGNRPPRSPSPEWPISTDHRRAHCPAASWTGARMRHPLPSRHALPGSARTAAHDRGSQYQPVWRGRVRAAWSDAAGGHFEV